MWQNLEQLTTLIREAEGVRPIVESAGLTEEQAEYCMDFCGGMVHDLTWKQEDKSVAVCIDYARNERMELDLSIQLGLLRDTDIECQILVHYNCGTDKWTISYTTDTPMISQHTVHNFLKEYIPEFILPVHGLDPGEHKDCDVELTRERAHEIVSVMASLVSP